MLDLLSSTFLMKGSMHLSPPMKRYVATFASHGSSLEKENKTICIIKSPQYEVCMPSHNVLLNNLIGTHARVRKGMYIRRGMQIICCSASMAFMDCWTV